MLNWEEVGKTIYLDSSVFQDIIQNRKSERLIDNLESAKLKGFKLPYSHAHIEDLLRCKRLDYINKDLLAIDKISACVLILKDDRKPNFYVTKASSIAVYEANKNENSIPIDGVKLKLEFQPYKVEVNLLNSNNLIIPYLKKFNSYMCPELLENLLNNFSEKVLSGHSLYRDFRNSFAEIVEIGKPVNQKVYDNLLYKNLFASKEEIEENFLEILESFLGLTGKKLSYIEESEKYTTAYGILDFFPIFKEKIEKKNNINNLLTDALHVFIASKCSMFISGDRKSIEKAKLLYRTFKVKTKVYYIDDFIQRVQI